MFPLFLSIKNKIDMSILGPLMRMFNIINLREVTFRIKCTACNGKSASHYYCKDYKENICNACQKAHLRVKITKNHSLTFLNK